MANFSSVLGTVSSALMFRADDKSALPAGSPTASVLDIPHWEESPEAYERVLIAGVLLPGVATVTGDGYKRRTDKKSTPGEHGETTTDLGKDVAEIDISVDLWTVQHLKDFRQMVKRILAPKVTKVKETKTEPYFVGYTGADATSNVVPASFSQTTTTVKTVVGHGPGPVDIYYPTLALFGITKVQVISVGLPTQKSKDVWASKLKCRQYIPHRAAKVTTNESMSIGALGNAFDKAKAAAPSTTAAAAPVPTPPPEVVPPPSPRRLPPTNYHILLPW